MVSGKMAASKTSWDEARDRLRKIREEQKRCSEEVVELWDECLSDFNYKLGDELWLIYEQVCIAACDCDRLEIAAQCIEALQAKFRDSNRVRRLQGLALEAQQKYDLALRIYDSILDTDTNNSLVRKRKIAIYKGQNKITEAIEELNKYVKQFMSDYEAWMELCDLYLGDMEHAKAAFCMEELIMSNPHNPLYHLKYAEIKYTQGGIENMMVARKYFAQALKANPNSMRALFGLFLSASNVASSKKGDAKIKTDNTKYAAWAADQISRKYKGKLTTEQTSQMKAVESMLNDLQITPSTQ